MSMTGKEWQDGLSQCLEPVATGLTVQKYDAENAA